MRRPDWLEIFIMAREEHLGESVVSSSLGSEPEEILHSLLALERFR